MGSLFLLLLVAQAGEVPAVVPPVSPDAVEQDAGAADEVRAAPDAGPGVDEGLDAGAPDAGAPVQRMLREMEERQAAIDEALAGSKESSAWQKVVQATGYLDSRFSFTRSRTWGLLPTDDLPQAQELVELNTQVKVNLRKNTFIYSDVSLVAAYGGQYRAMVNGVDTRLPDHASAQVQPVVSINELYAIHEVVPELNLLIGKKRVAWGSGLAFNPTDFWNPRRDPTDPTFQRSGAWLAQLEVPLEVMTFSFVFAPALLKQTSGIPTHFVVWPEWDQRDDQAHYELAARAYALVGDADVNLMFFYGNRYNDDFEKKFRVGLSFSKYFFTDYELHVEALLQTGSTRDYLNPDCVASGLAALACVQTGKSVVVKSKLDSTEILPKVLVGTRRQFSDDSLLSLEYLYQADGWTKADFQSFANGLDLLAQGRSAGLPVNRIPGAAALLGGGTGADGLPARVSFDPRGQHYLFVTYQKPRIHDDFTAQLALIASLQDLSTLWSPSIAWSTTEWLTLTLFGFIPVPGPDSMAVKTPAGVPTSELGITPFAFRVMFEARAWF